VALAEFGCAAANPPETAKPRASNATSAEPVARPPEEPASLVLLHGKVLTLEQAGTAEAVAARGDRIAFIGSDAEVSALIGPATTVIDLKGATAIPGFVEGHGHFMGLGDRKLTLDLRQAQSFDDIIALVAEAVGRARPGDPIFGRGWHQEKWLRPPEPSLGGLPVHTKLSAVSPDNPVLLTHASGHAIFVNRKALDMSGIGDKTPDPPGGTIVRDKRRHATGMLSETAADLLRIEPLRDEATQRKRAALAAEECLANGITSFQDAGSSFETIAVFKRLAEERALPVRLWVMARDTDENLRRELPTAKLVGFGEQFLTVRAIKHAIDGALGSHGAWLLAPYTDMPSSSGLNTTSLDVIRESARLAKQHGFQLAVHAIGDRGNRETLNLYQEVLGADARTSDHRWRIEHAQHVDPSDVPRFASLGVIASMQGVHCTSDGPWVAARLGDKRAEAESYLWRSLLDHGVVVSNGTDAPVEDVNPLKSYYATVTRRMSSGAYFYPNQRMTRLEALRSYTLSAAYAGFEESEKGSLKAGKLADITVLSDDILSIPDDALLQTRVLYTIVGGQVRYRAQ
jgi:hypothetical protein